MSNTDRLADLDFKKAALARAVRQSSAALLLIVFVAGGCRARDGENTVAAGTGVASDNAVAANQAVVAGTGESVGSAAEAVRFTDVTAAAAIRFRHNNGAFGAKWAPETMGSGVAFFDFDGDGDADLFFVNGRNWTERELAAYRNGNGRQHARQHGFVLPPNRPPARTTGSLYRNNGDGSFSDVTKASGLGIETYGMGVASADYDNDGRADLFLTSYDRTYLFHNRGGGRFVDVTDQAGVRGPQTPGATWSTSAAWVDYDRDGKLDLFVCYYTNWTAAGDIYLDQRGAKIISNPNPYRGSKCFLYHNVGSRFVDVSAAMGIWGGRGRALFSKAMGVAILDYNNDLWPDIVVTNDLAPNFLFRNEGGKRFTEQGLATGIALDGMAGVARAGMGVDVADLDHSNRESLVISNFSGEMMGVHQNIGNGLFVDVAPGSVVGRETYAFVGFGLLCDDYDNDGWPDIFVANGHINDIIGQVTKLRTFAQRPLLFHNETALDKSGATRRKAVFREVGPSSGAALDKPLVGRGLATADFDLDGDLDFVISANNGRPELLRNDGAHNNHSLRVVLRGERSNRDGIGAVVWAEVDGDPSDSVRKRVRGGGSYCSQSELPLTIGLGAHRSAALVIRWPSGQLTRLPDVAADQIVTIDEKRGLLRRSPLRRRSS